ncbi:hypothetical protein VJI72_04525 [Parvimonas micra]|jgi:hypothetical protein|uniref:Lipoprotein n=2 Tax=Parvimonas micra TaxID=33033 RepID=A0A0B4S393_9FIRM|nr:hypothetical protein [Parvimonas micra]AIZ37096.1 hypothetical protein NW74_07050 [Parvimonas micra]EDP24242.1 hypothetical protein PEPMIC_00824 [Parvimonas micra ATCC 33270]MBF1276069.1 hypothetical protein [Parvimonas micra]MBF1307005.1 hypothetical protein [Parvimonas micra]MEB3029056.1 hypothetical protein [Parvimonas micra]
MKKRFLITALIICFCGAIVSCKPKEKPEEKSKDNSQVNVKEKKVKENIQEDNSDKKEDKKSEENKEEKGLNFVIKDLGNNNVKMIAKKGSKMPFDIYTVGMEFKLKLDGKEYSVKDAISNGILDEDKLLQKLEQDKKDNKSTSEMYKDGGTIIYRYKDYSIVKYNTVDGDEDMYFTREKDLESLENVLNNNR